MTNSQHGLKVSKIHLFCQDFLQNVHGKEINLLRVTVKVPGKRPPRAMSSGGSMSGLNGVPKDALTPEGPTPGAYLWATESDLSPLQTEMIMDHADLI